MPPPPPPMQTKLMPLRALRRFLKVNVSGGVFLYLMFAVNAVTSVLLAIVQLGMRKIRLRRFCGFMMTFTMSPRIELDFDFGRMLSYFPHLLAADRKFTTLRLGMRSAEELLGPQRIPSNDEFISHVLQRTPLAFYIHNEPTKLVLDLSLVSDLNNFDRTYYEVHKVEVDKATSNITIHTHSGGPVDSSTATQEDFERAKLHAMATCSYFVPGIGHSWAHFLFADAVSAVVFNNLDRKSTLYRLLAPHTRYTNRINWEALGVRGPLVFGTSALVRMAAEATSATPRGEKPKGVLAKFEPWTPFSMTGEEFVRKNTERTTQYYFRSDEFECPPKWFKMPTRDLPYVKYMVRYYPVIRKHVEKVLAHEDPATVADFIRKVDEVSTVPDGPGLNLSSFDPIDVIASFIFDVVVIHSTDHYQYFKVFQEARFGIGTLRHPYTRKWFPGTRVPGDLCDDEDRIRFFNFANIFVRFNDTPLLSNRIASIKYRFRQPALRNADKELVEAIRKLQDSMIEDGDVVCPMESMASSVCFERGTTDIAPRRAYRRLVSYSGA